MNTEPLQLMPVKEKLAKRNPNAVSQMTERKLIEAKDKQFVRFFHLYRNDAGTQELRALIRRTKTFSLIPDLRVEIDLWA